MYIDYNIYTIYDLIRDYKKKGLNKNELDISTKMKKECQSFGKIKLFIFNELCFLTPYTISVYIPHILKINHRDTFLTHFLPNKDLSIEDFIIDQQNNENCLFIQILKNRLIDLKNANYINSIDFGLGINIEGDKGFLYTNIPTNLLEQSLTEIDLINFGNVYIGGFTSERTSIIRNTYTSSNDEKDYSFFRKNEDYLRGMSTQELILFFIYHELKEYTLLPRLIIYENLIDLMGHKIYINKNLNFLEFDPIMKSGNDFIYTEKFPLILQKYYEIDKNYVNEILVDIDTYFKIEKDNIYFFEIKSKLYDGYLEKNLKKIIKNIPKFYNLFITNEFISRKEMINIILIYDYRKLQIDVLGIIHNLINKYKNNLKFNLKIIYCLPNYSYFSFSRLNNDLREMKKKQKEQNELMEKKIKEQNEKNESMEKKLKEQNELMEKKLKEQKELMEKQLKEQKELMEKQLKEQKELMEKELKEQKELMEKELKALKEKMD